MAYTFNAEGYRNLIRRKAQERFPNAKDPISDLADAVYEQTCETPSIKDKVDFRCRVHKWLSPEVKTLPRIPEQVIAMADILNVRIDDLYHGQEGQSPADVISYYSVAVNDDVSRYDTLKSQCGNFPDGYDEFDKQFIDYIVEYKAVHVMDKAVKEKDYDTTHMLMDVNNSSIYVGRMLPLFQREFLPELFDAFYDPRNRWILQGDTSEGNGFIPCRIKLAKEDVVALLDQPAFIAKVASEHQQKKAGEWTYSVTFVHECFLRSDARRIAAGEIPRGRLSLAPRIFAKRLHLHPECFRQTLCLSEVAGRYPHQKPLSGPGRFIARARGPKKLRRAKTGIGQLERSGKRGKKVRKSFKELRKRMRHFIPS
jgi:hypothetical protein